MVRRERVPQSLPCETSRSGHQYVSFLKASAAERLGRAVQRPLCGRSEHRGMTLYACLAS